MKRPHLIHLAILLQCAMIIGVAVLYIGFEDERAKNHERLSQLELGQIALSNQLTDASVEILLDVMRKLTGAEERCYPTPDIRTHIYEEKDRVSDHACRIDRYEQTLQEYTCTEPPRKETRIKSQRHIGTFQGSCN